MIKLLFHWYTEVYVPSCTEYAARVQIVSLICYKSPFPPEYRNPKTDDRVDNYLKRSVTIYSLNFFMYSPKWLCRGCEIASASIVVKYYGVVL